MSVVNDVTVEEDSTASTTESKLYTEDTQAGS